MDREKYLKLKYCPETPFCRAARAGILVIAVMIMSGAIYNLGMLIWSFVRLASL